MFRVGIRDWWRVGVSLVSILGNGVTCGISEMYGEAIDDYDDDDMSYNPNKLLVSADRMRTYFAYAIATAVSLIASGVLILSSRGP